MTLETPCIIKRPSMLHRNGVKQFCVQDLRRVRCVELTAECRNVNNVTQPTNNNRKTVVACVAISIISLMNNDIFPYLFHCPSFLPISYVIVCACCLSTRVPFSFVSARCCFSRQAYVSIICSLISYASRLAQRDIVTV